MPASEFKFRGVEAEDVRSVGVCTALKTSGKWWSSADTRVAEWSRKQLVEVGQWIFFHIPKCAGSSLADALSETAAKAGLEVCNGKSNARSICKDSNAAFVHGHQFFGLGDDARERGLAFRSFTFLRHPVARVVSLYDYIRRKKNHPR